AFAVALSSRSAIAFTPTGTASTERSSAPVASTMRPSVMIGGAPATMTAGTSVQLSALVAHSHSPVTWRVSAGSITPAGLFTAPSRAPRGDTVVLSAVAAHARDQRRLTIAPVASAQPA